MLASPGDLLLVVAHNAVNQAMICTALGLPPSYFRRLVQSNAAATVLDIQPCPAPLPPQAGKASPDRLEEAATLSEQPNAVARLVRLNQSPGPPFKADDVETGTMPRVVLVSSNSSAGSSGGSSAPSASTPDMVAKTAALLHGLPLHGIIVAYAGADGSDLMQMVQMAKAIAAQQPEKPSMTVLSQVGPQQEEEAGPNGAWSAALEVWASSLIPAAIADGGQTIAVVVDADQHAALVCNCLTLPKARMAAFNADACGVSIFEFARGVEATANGRCINYTGHLQDQSAASSRL